MGAAFVFSNLIISPDAVYPLETITVTVDVTNTGDVEGSTDVHLTGWWVLTKKAYPAWNGVPMIDPGETVTVVFQFAPSATHAPRANCPIIVEGLAGSVEVLALPTTFSFSNLTISPAAVYPLETITVSVDVTNTGGTAGSVDVHLTGWGVLTKNSGVIQPGQIISVVFSFAPSATMTPRNDCPIIVEGLEGSVDVLAVEGDSGILSVTTIPSGGEVFVDGASVGFGPLEVTLAAGSYTVSFGEVAGYTPPDPISVTVHANAGTLVEGIYVADFETGHLTVVTTQTLADGESAAVEARIYLDDVYAGTTTTAGLELTLPAKVYVVSFGAITGFRTPASQTIEVTVGGYAIVYGEYQEGVSAKRNYAIPAAMIGLLGTMVALGRKMK